jgi:hypothetical protein
METARSGCKGRLLGRTLMLSGGHGSPESGVVRQLACLTWLAGRRSI